jgi:hypothetical protein
VPIWLIKVLVYGHLGVLLEFYFTGLGALFKKSWKLTGCSYLWMPVLYGGMALILEEVSRLIPWPFYFKAFVYVGVIYTSEAAFGMTLLFVTKYLQKWFGGSDGGQVPWNYGRKWTLLGAVEPRYFPFWYVLALTFGPLSDKMNQLLRMVGSVGG